MQSRLYKSIYGNLHDGTRIEAYELRNGAGLIARIMSRGATLLEMHTPDRAGAVADITLGYDTLEGWLRHENPYMGSIVGRYANRIAEGKFSLDGIYGEHHGLIHSDFRSLEAYPVKLPDDVVFLMINPHIKHTLADSPYNARCMSCEKAAKELGALLDHPVTALRDISWEEFEANKDKIDPEAAERATHIIWEITRVEEGVKLLKNGKLEAFGQFLYDSHETSRTAFENSCGELDIVVEAARRAGALGARLSGGGRGGSVVALVHEADADAICAKIIDICRVRGLEPTAETVIPSSGATIIK